jgi:proliferating cell nuclear antigen
MTREGACPHPSEAAVCRQCSIERRAEERAKARTDGGVAEARPAFEAIVAADVLAETIDAVDCLVNECKIHLDDGGLRIAAVDPANVGMVALDLDAPAFESYHAHGGTIGVDLERLGDVVGMADSGDLVHLRLDDETRKLHIEAGGLSYTLALIDPEAIRQEPDIPDLELPATTRLPAGELERGVTAADLCSNHITLGADEDVFLMSAEGDTDDVRVTVDAEECERHDVSESVRSLFSLDYLDDMTGPMAGDVTVRLGDEFPVKMHWSYAEGHGEVTMMLAPRIQSD